MGPYDVICICSIDAYGSAMQEAKYVLGVVTSG
jgi:hypothetical protein